MNSSLHNSLMVTRPIFLALLPDASLLKKVPKPSLSLVEETRKFLSGTLTTMPETTFLRLPFPSISWPVITITLLTYALLLEMSLSFLPLGINLWDSGTSLMELSSRLSSDLKKRSILAESLLTPKSSIPLDLTTRPPSGTLLDNSRLNLLTQLILMLFPNWESLPTQRTITLLLLDGMDLSRSGLSLDNAKLLSELMKDLSMPWISTRTDSIS